MTIHIKLAINKCTVKCVVLKAHYCSEIGFITMCPPLGASWVI